MPAPRSSGASSTELMYGSATRSDRSGSATAGVPIRPSPPGTGGAPRGPRPHLDGNWLLDHCADATRTVGRSEPRLAPGRWFASLARRARPSVFARPSDRLRRADLQTARRRAWCGGRPRCRRGSRWLGCGNGLGGRCSRSGRRHRSRRARRHRRRRRGLRKRRGRRLGCRRRGGSTPRRKEFEWVDVALASADPDTEMNVREVVLCLAG